MDIIFTFALRLRSAVPVAFCILLYLCHATAITEPHSLLRGMIRDSYGRPIPGVLLVLYSSSEVKVTKSGREGDFGFDSLSRNVYGLEARIAGFRDETLESIAIPTKQDQPLLITMTWGNFPYHCGDDPVSYTKASEIDGAEVTGVVRKDYSSIAHSRVNLFMADGTVAIASQRTGREGKFWFRNLAPGKYSLQVSRKSYDDHQSQNFWVGQGIHTEVKIEMVKAGWSVTCQ